MHPTFLKFWNGDVVFSTFYVSKNVPTPDRNIPTFLAAIAAIYVAFYNQPYIFTKKCDKNILSSKLYPESSNDEDTKCL